MTVVQWWTIKQIIIEEGAGVIVNWLKWQGELFAIQSIDIWVSYICFILTDWQWVYTGGCL